MSLLSRAHCSYRARAHLSPVVHSRLGQPFVGCVRTERLHDVPRRRYHEISLDDWARRPEPEAEVAG